MAPVSMALSDLPDFKVAILFDVKISKMVQNRATVTMADQYRVAYGLSNSAILNDLE